MNAMYFVEHQGKRERYFVECDRDTNSRANVIALIRTIDVVPVKILEVCEDEGTCRDVTEEIMTEAFVPLFDRPNAADALAAKWDRARDERKHGETV